MRTRPLSASAGFVYFLKPVGLPGPIKIGFSAQPVDRLKALMAWSPIPLELVVAIPGTVGLEVSIQNCVASSHSHCEWFLPTDKVTKLVTALVAGTPVEVAIDLPAPEGSVRSKYTRGVPRPNGRGPRRVNAGPSSTPRCASAPESCQ